MKNQQGVPGTATGSLVRRTDFPAGFRWGCATSAYQIEGGQTEGGRGESIWDRFCTVPGAIVDGSSGALACDHFHRWREDLDLLRDLGNNAYRFSVAWPRVQPSGRGAPNAAGLDFYERLVDGLLERGIEPWATLYHWDLPQALQEEGGWPSRALAPAFAEYAHHVARRLGDRVRHWITHNEPWCSAFIGHYEGRHAPGLRDWGAAIRACHTVLLSHGLAARALRETCAHARVGISLSLHPVRSATGSPADRAAALRQDGIRNRWFLDPLHGRGYPGDILALCGRDVPPVLDGDLATIAAPLDFLGVNYYFPETVAHVSGDGPLSARVLAREGAERTALGWEVYPEGMVDLLARVAREYSPREMLVTESGSCYDDVPAPDGRVPDEARRRYLERHIAAARDSLARGVPLGGFFAWTLIDNFEWAEGYTRRFGLAWVDFTTQVRRLKASGEWYRKFLRDGAGD